MTWEDAEDIAIALHETYPDLDPTYIRYTDLHQMVCELDGFTDDPKRSTEGKLEAIQMAWLDERED
jgi:FeS assembly protein IscX